MKDIKEAILKATRNNVQPYTKEQAAAYAEIFEHVIAVFAENNALSYEEAYNQIVPSFSNDLWMKAPNGNPTKLTERQWLQVRTPEFKAWFGDWENDPANASKVVDENGEPLVVYHGASPLASFDVFRGSPFGSMGAGSYLRGFSEHQKSVAVGQSL